MFTDEELVALMPRMKMWAAQFRHIDEPEDLVQGAMVLALKHRYQFSGESKLSTWLNRVLVNHALSVYRKKRIRPMDSMPSSFDELLPMFDPGLNPEALLMENERVTQLMEAVGKLPPSCKLGVNEYLHPKGPMSNTNKVRRLRAVRMLRFRMRAMKRAA
jgi:RNA polymerase sigma factor (sigma-70 family)